MAKLTRYAPDMKIVVAVIAASYVGAVLFTFLPALAPGSIAAKLTPSK